MTEFVLSLEALRCCASPRRKVVAHSNGDAGRRLRPSSRRREGRKGGSMKFTGASTISVFLSQAWYFLFVAKPDAPPQK